MKPTTRALKAWIAEAALLAVPPEQIRVPVENDRLFLTVYSVCRQAIRYAEAYSATAASGFEHEAVPLVRAAFEHAVTAQWVYLTPGGHALLSAGVRASMHDFQVRFAQRAGDHVWMDHLELSTPPKVHGRPNFGKMMRAVDHEEFLELIYSLLSQATHVTFRSVTGYLDGSSEQFELLPERRVSAEVNYQVLHAAAMSSLLALSVLAHVIDDPQLLDLVSRRSDELMLPWLLESGSARDSSTGTGRPVGRPQV
ncbi:DUF5677 domain-containing protein [uncultured Cellulomonas sp.]|uniref:DUF5677 domain-containing protein n=1 Tax=uncultured Cellulomonas sp. TaxID=189682 RepID=UPI0028E70177|nr:DUF5677 domain-containing protein [uncultured Cellulomonas sp.]